MARHRPPLPEGPFLVVGLARSGAAIARVLAARGAEVIGVDSGRPTEAEGLERAGVEVHLDGDGEELLGRVGSVVKSPGVPRETRVIQAALDRGLDVAGELELAWRLLPNRFAAVTGTNGKTTVTELVGHVLRTAGEPVEVAGNVGTPLASLVGRSSPDATVVCECSSFQLEDTEAFAPDCAVLLPITPDHLDRHRTMNDYVAAKLRLFANQGPEDFAIYDSGDPGLAGRAIPGRGRQVDLAEVPDEAVEGLKLLGTHNMQNARAAAAACLALGAPRDAVRAGLETFPGVPHRLELVAEVAGVRYVNDSKATNVAAAAAALESFEGGVRAILGGSLKGGSFEDLAPAVSGRCVACYLIGPAAERLELDLESARRAGVELHRCDGLAAAFAAASSAAARGEVVLLAPACASFDAYRDFEERGEHFRSLVEELPG